MALKSSIWRIFFLNLRKGVLNQK